MSPLNDDGEVDGLTYLDNFHRWRTENGIRDLYPNDNAQLFSGLKFKGNSGGFAGVGKMCHENLSGAISAIGGSHALSVVTVAHELGHNLGMDHACATHKGHVMNRFLVPSTNLPSVTFSDCSKRYMKDEIERFTCVTTTTAA
jgi:hypothetical protein